MFTVSTVVGVVLLYVALLFVIALWGEKKGGLGQRLAATPAVYTFAIAVYCTTWTYYGSVGKAATSGFSFLPIYLGPILVCIFFWPLIAKMARLKHQYHITSIADFISARYGKSHALAAITTVVLLIGVVPYVALQFKAVTATFTLLTRQNDTAGGEALSVLLLVLMVAFTILFGVRRLDPTERHQGMMLALAVESLVKLAVLTLAGLFVVYGMFDGLGDLIDRATRLTAGAEHLAILEQPPDASTWLSLIMLSAGAFILLPRQFHVMIVENSDDRQIATAQWLLPLYLLVINLFVIPIAVAGLAMGLPARLADSFVLRLPMEAGQPLLSLLVFIGGFSAATSMVIVASMTMSTMVTNHLLLPLLEWVRALHFLRRYLLQFRWAAVILFLTAGYLCYRLIGNSHMLVSIGIISFVAVFQLAPATIGGLFWKGGNRCGATCGIVSGYLLWGYCLILPALVKSGWLDASVMEGPWGVSALRPEQLFGLALHPVSYAMFWSSLVNVVGYVLGSLLFQPNEQDEQQARNFVEVKEEAAPENVPLAAEIPMEYGYCLQRSDGISTPEYQ